MTDNNIIIAVAKLDGWKCDNCDEPKCIGSMLQAVVMLTGIGESIHDVKAAMCFIAGYSFGSIAGVFIERRITKPS